MILNHLSKSFSEKFGFEEDDFMEDDFMEDEIKEEGIFFFRLMLTHQSESAVSLFK
jgi:hypothetical protein